MYVKYEQLCDSVYTWISYTPVPNNAMGVFPNA